MKQSVDFIVEGMQCGDCVEKLRTALMSLPGVHEVSASFESGRAQVEFETTEMHINRLDLAIHEAGFKTPPGCP